MEQNYCVYEYMTVSASRKNSSETANRYESLGWQLEKQENALFGKTALTFKRNRNIKNKEQLNRLQIRIEDGISGIEFLQASKTKKARITACALGATGALIFGGGMSLCMFNAPAVSLAFLGGISLGIVGLAACGISVMLYQMIAKRKTAKANILINKKKDEVLDLCADAHRATAMTSSVN